MQKEQMEEKFIYRISLFLFGAAWALLQLILARASLQMGASLYEIHVPKCQCGCYAMQRWPLPGCRFPCGRWLRLFASKLLKCAAKFSLRKKFPSSLLRQNFLLRENFAATVYNFSGTKIANL
jgi:hypothetical protein